MASQVICRDIHSDMGHVTLEDKNLCPDMSLVGLIEIYADTCHENLDIGTEWMKKQCLMLRVIKCSMTQTLPHSLTH